LGTSIDAEVPQYPRSYSLWATHIYERIPHTPTVPQFLLDSRMLLKRGNLVYIPPKDLHELVESLLLLKEIQIEDRPSSIRVPRLEFNTWNPV
jgi:hypothetical protein